MERLQFEIGEETVLRVTNASNDLAVKGGDFDQIELVVDGERTDVMVEQQESALSVECHVSLVIHLPDNAVVRIGQVGGDLALLHLNNEASVDNVMGDCATRFGAANLSIGAVNGDLVVENVAGLVSIGSVQGDMRLIDMGKAVTVGSVGGDTRLRGVAADVKIANVLGDVRAHDIAGMLTIDQLNGTFKGSNLMGGMAIHTLGDLSLKSVLTPGRSYQGQAQGDMSVRVPANTSARFTLKAEGGISTRLLQVEEKEAGCVEGQMGDGEATVVLEAAGHLSLKPSEEWQGDWNLEFDFGEGLSAQIQAQVARQLEGVDFGNLAQEEIARMMSKIERKVAHAQERAQEVARQAEEHARRAQEKAQHAQERAQRAAERAAQRVEMHARRWGDARNWNVSVNAELGRKRPKVSQEEQLRILQMLQEGKISIEEAELLLKALEG
ncbi:MAG: hypothetical protein JW934_06565 [Anaerolineae bacterium]|nr:hypothetical protein [Anaerolineae bacterium]